MEILRNYSRKDRALDLESGSRSSILNNVKRLNVPKIQKHYEIIFVFFSILKILWTSFVSLTN